MSDLVQPATTGAPAVTWRHRALGRTAASIGAAVVLAGVAPALANAAGADVANPVAIALRASGKGLNAAFGGEESATCVTPTASPSVEPSVEPSIEPSVEPSVDPSAEATPSEPVEPSVEPSGSPNEAPSEQPAEECAEEPEATPSVSESPEAETEAADGEHGQIVSTVAQCAPKGQDPLLDAEGAPARHGDYVKVAAHGDTLTTPWGAFDLSTQAGADDLCAALEAARAALPEVTASTEKSKGKKAKAERDRSGKGGHGKGHGKDRGES